MQSVNCAFMIIPNAHILVKDCEWASPLARASAFIKWSSWNALFTIFVIHARNANFWYKRGKSILQDTWALYLYWTRLEIPSWTRCLHFELALHCT